MRNQLLIDCGTLKTSFPDHKAAIEELEKSISKVTRWTGDIQGLQTRVLNLRTALEKAKKETNAAKKAEKESQDKEARERSEQELSSFKQKLYEACHTPRDIRDGELYDVAVQLKKANGKLADLKGVTVPTFYLGVLSDYYKEFEAYYKEQEQIVTAISNVLSIDERESITAKVKTFQEIATTRQTRLRQYQTIADRLRNLVNELTRIENKLPSDLFSSLDEAGLAGDKLAIDQKGCYCNINPICKTKTNQEPSSSHPVVKPNTTFEKLYNDIKNARIQILKAIDLDAKAENETAGQDKPGLSCIALLEQYNEKVSSLANKVKEHSKFLEQKEHAKDNLKLDKNNRDHLQYWHNQTTHCWHGFGGTQIQLGDEVFRIPSRVYRMMQIVALDHENTESFYQELNKARTNSLLSNPLLQFSVFADNYRAKATTLLYSVNDEEIKTYKIDSTPRT